MKIGEFTLSSPYILAPMAGVTDLPFRNICRKMGAGLAVSEMVNANSELWNTDISLLRTDFGDEQSPISAQILGYDPLMMAEAARFNVENGADIIDINMGCPAKKVCKKAAGSALLQDEPLVATILNAVVNAVDVPVTLKIRTGWDNSHKNAVTIAKIAETIGIQALTIHGRTREQRFSGVAEYDTIAEVKANISIPVIANGDIDSVEKAREVFAYTNVDAVMIGRAAYGNPWIFQSLINEKEYIPAFDEMVSIISKHIASLYEFYGETKGVRIARKHLLWYLSDKILHEDWRRALLSAKTKQEQFLWIEKILISYKEAA